MGKSVKKIVIILTCVINYVSVCAFFSCADAIQDNMAGGKNVELHRDYQELLSKYSVANVREFGAKGDGITDDTGAITKAINSPSYEIIFPPGTYKVTFGLSVPSGKTLKGFGPDNTKFQYYDQKGTAITVNGNGAVRGIKLESKGDKQNGICVNGMFPLLEDVWIEEFQGVSLRLGETDVVGSYFARIDSVYIFNKKTRGDKGIVVDGGPKLSSNANIFRNVFVKGKFATFIHLKGNNNAWYNGDTEWSTSGREIDDIWLIEGSGNIVIGPYMEAESVSPKYVFRFTSSSGKNTVKDVFAEFPADNFSSKIFDEGYGNELNFRPLVPGKPFPIKNSGLTNLIPNSSFKIWHDGSPDGWTIERGIFSRESIVLKEATYSLKATASSDNPIINCYIAGHPSSVSGLSIDRFKGKTIAVGVWAKTNKPGMGNIKVWVDGTGGGKLGDSRHTGDDTWQFLNAMIKVPDAATFLAVQLRGFSAGTGSGEVFFSAPILIEGIHLPNPSPSFLDDSHAKMTGVFIHNYPIIFSDGDVAPSVRDGNIFKTMNSSSTVIEGFKDGSPGQEITVIFGDSNTTVDFTKTHLKGNHGANWLPFKNDHMKCVCDGINWYCSISSNTRQK